MFRFLLMTICIVLSMYSHAGDITGRLQLTAQYATTGDDSLDALLGEQNRNDLIGDVRLIWEPYWDSWNFSVHLLADIDHGDSVSYQQKISAYEADDTTSSLLDLSASASDGNTRLNYGLDRLVISKTTPTSVIRIGRQALTWGSGQIFHPIDLVDPFAPGAVDTEYKSGVDMAYTQWLFDNGSDLQLIAVPRYEQADKTVTWNASTAGLLYRHSINQISTTWLLAQDYEDWTSGIGLSGGLAGAAWNMEVVPTLENNNKVKTSALANISYSTLLYQRNTTLFVEYYHNGFGTTDTNTAYDELPDDLMTRLTRGQLFTIARNYLATGFTLEWNPLLNISPSIIANLDDGSTFSTMEINWSLHDNANLLIGAQLPTREKDTEYGGILLSNGSSTYLSSPTTVYLQLRVYF